jgi:FAD/FMN-containing dehydrogenase
MLHESIDTREALPPSAYERLCALRRALDPDGLFMVPHPPAPRRSDEP